VKNRKRRRFFVFIFLLLFAGACTAGGGQPTYTLPLQIELAVTPETVHVGQRALIEAVVTQGSDKVVDASEAIFEIAKKGERNYEELAAKSKGDGTYAIEKTFTAAGTYTIKAKVTAQDLTAVSSQVIKVKEE
jgi:hypothetical protein